MGPGGLVVAGPAAGARALTSLAIQFMISFRYIYSIRAYLYVGSFIHMIHRVFSVAPLDPVAHASRPDGKTEPPMTGSAPARVPSPVA